MDWLQLAWAALIAAALLWGPGGLLGWIAGLRGVLLYSLAPAFGATVVVVASLGAPFVGLGWSVWAVILVALVLAVIVALLRWWLGGREPFRLESPRVRSLTSVALVIAAALLTFRVIEMFGVPEAFSQTFDNVFHMNAVRYMLDSGNASSLWVGTLTSPPGGQPFYPAAWHALVALVVQLGGVSIPLAINAVTIVVSALVWPAGILLLARVWFGAGGAVTIAAGVLAAAAPQFPLLLQHYGVLYPLQFGLALVPAAIALTSLLLKATAAKGSVPPLWASVLLIGMLPGIAVAHPGAFVAWLALTAPVVALWFVRAFRADGTWGRRIALGAGAAVYLVAGVLFVKVLRPPADARGWPPTDSVPAAIFDALSLGAHVPAPALVIGALTIVGLVVALRRHSAADLSAVGVWLTATFLYVIVASCEIWPVRDVLTGSWYNNVPRLAAMLPIAVVPLAALGAAAIWSAVSTRLPDRRAVSGWVAVGAAALLVVISQIGGIPATVRFAHEDTFALRDNSPVIDRDELALLQRLDETVPEHAVIAGSPWTGVALAYALSGRQVLMPHMLTYESDEMRDVNEGLRDADRRAGVCDALGDLGVEYVLDFGSREVHGDEHEYAGLERLESSDAVELVDSEGHARLYRIVACG